MRLYVEQKMFAFADTFSVLDESGTEIYYVKNELFSLTHALHVYHHAGYEAGVIRQKFFTLLPRFNVEINGQDAGSVYKEFTLLRPKYNCDYNGWEIEGDFFGLNYEIVDLYGNHVASISRELFHFTDHYVLDIASEKDALYVLMLVLAIDAVKCSEEHAHH